VAFIHENYSSISHVQIKDRTRNGGANGRFGEEDTPIKDVLTLIKDSSSLIPAFIEYEYIGLGSPPGRSQKIARCSTRTTISWSGFRTIGKVVTPA
jgi:hypothetical protein